MERHNDVQEGPIGQAYPRDLVWQLSAGESEKRSPAIINSGPEEMLKYRYDDGVSSGLAVWPGSAAGSPEYYTISINLLPLYDCDMPDEIFFVTLSESL